MNNYYPKHYAQTLKSGVLVLGAWRSIATYQELLLMMEASPITQKCITATSLTILSVMEQKFTQRGFTIASILRKKLGNLLRIVVENEGNEVRGMRNLCDKCFRTLTCPHLDLIARLKKDQVEIGFIKCTAFEQKGTRRKRAVRRGK